MNVRFFGRRVKNDARVGAIRAVWTRRSRPQQCTACGEVRGLYVYANNARNYCIACARDLWEVAGLQPAGRRTEDLTLEELIQYEVGGEHSA